MRARDLHPLQRPYDLRPDGMPISDFAIALGLNVQNVRDLVTAIRGDLDPQQFGISWWRSAQETNDQLQQRILVSDYLVTAVEGIESYLVQVRLHYLELQDWWEREAEFVRDTFRLGPGGQLTAKMPPRLRPVDDLIHEMADIHTGGVFRAIGSVLDCMASAVIGVAGLEANILRADWGRLWDQTMLRLTDDGSRGRALQLAGRNALQGHIMAGRTDWDEWASDYRNMLVHRAQRMKISSLSPESHLVDARGTPIVRARTTPVLTRDPELSEVESFALRDRVAPVLTEDAHITLDGVMNDLAALVTNFAGSLLDLWRTRRADPTILAQPVGRQWPEVRRNSRRHFAGYQPGQTPFNPSAFTANPNYVERLQAAGLTNRDATRVWP